MNINLIYDLGGTEYAFKSVFQGFANFCVCNINDINFNIIDSKSRGYTYNNNKYGPLFMMIENDDTKKYILISYWDKLVDIINHYDVTNFDVDNIIEIITSAGTYQNDLAYTPTKFNYTPFSYIVNRSDSESKIENVYSMSIEKRQMDRLKFRGYLYDFRSFLKEDARFDIIDCRSNGQYNENYIEELANSSVNLSLNGAAEICHRDIEILGVGSALFRFELSTKFSNPLIPDYHYISVPYRDIKVENHSLKSYYDSLSDRLFNRFEEIKNQPDYIKFVSDNGRRWYQENGTINANIKLLTQLVDFTKLK